MRKILVLTFLLCFVETLLPKPQLQTIKNKIIMQARDMGDTLIARLDNKLYYTLKTDGGWNIVDGNVIFHPFTASDTSAKDRVLKYVTDKSDLVKRLRNGDTIRNYFMVDMKLSFTDFTDVQVETEVPEPPVVYKSLKKEKKKEEKKGSSAKETVKKVTPVHPAPHHKKKVIESVPFSKPIVFNNCVFGPIVGDTSTEIFEEDANKKKRIEFEDDVLMVNCTFTKGIEIADCDFKGDFVLAGQLLSKTPSLIDNCQFSGMCYLYSSPELGDWQSSFNFNLCTFSKPFVFTATNSDRAHFAIERCKISNVLSFGRGVPDYIARRFRLSYSGPDYFYRLDDYTDWYTEYLTNKYTREYETDDDTIQDFAHNDRILYNVSVFNCRIKYLDLANTNLHDCSFENVEIGKCVDVTNCDFTYTPDYKGKEALEDITFPGNDGIIYAGYRTFSPETFKLGTYMEKIQIHPLVHNYYDSSSDFLTDNTNFYNMIKDYSAKKFTNEEMTTSLKARYEHEKSMWAKTYYAAHVKHSEGFGDFVSSLFHWVLAGFLETTVATGYRGEWRFAFWVLFLIITFSLIYYFRHHDAVIDYLNSMYNKDENAIANYSTMKVYKSFNGFRDYMRCLWFSCLVFIDPRLPITFFNLRVGLFGLVLTEWLFGLTAILLFLVFLASNYPFIHSLIGI